MDNRLCTVLFDLDGTVADTAPDLAFALNTVLAEEGRPALPIERIRPVITFGTRGLIELGFGIDADHPSFHDLRERLLALYSQHLVRQTRLFPGIPQLLDALEQRGLNWGIVTNKPGWLTEPLVAQLGLAQRAACVVSGDTTAQPKPHPGCMLYACERVGSQADQCLYIGDAQCDIEAGKRAGMKTLIALYGYIPSIVATEHWGADGTIDHPMAIVDWIETHA